MSEARSAGPIASGQGSNPAAPNYVPGVPSNFNPVYFQDFTGGVNTLVSRVAVQDNQTAWCDGWMPLGQDSLRCLPDFDSQPIYTAPGGTTAIWYGFANLQNTFFCIILRSDGAVDAAIVGPPFTVTNILPPGTVLTVTPNLFTFRVSQWEARYVLMVASQPNGYWIWDGTNVYTAGTVAPIINITDPGTDPALSQLVYIGTPQPDGSIITVANAHTVFDNNGLSQVVIDAITDTTIAQGVQLIVGFGPTGGGLSTAFGFANVGFGVITAATITNGGSGYTSVPTVTITDGTGSSAVVVVSGASGGIITSLMVVAGGDNYSGPTVTISGGGGSGATAQLTVSNGVIQSVVPWQPGNGYTGTPTVSFVSPNNSGSGAVGIPLVSGGHVTNVTITSGGVNYQNPTYYIVSDGNGPAAATATQFPYGIQGTAIEVYKSRVWISNGRAFVNNMGFAGRTLFSVADNPAEFGPDGGAFQATDSFTRIGYTNLIQANGFLWLIGDNSLNYISNIQTNAVGSPPIPVTTFSNINADPMVGSFWPSSVYVYGRNIVMSNLNGMYVSSGGAVTKVSEALDGIWHTNDAQLSGEDDFSGGVATVYGRNLYCMLLPLLDKISGNIETYLQIWDGKRCFTCHQGMPLTFVASFNASSYSKLYGTDGHTIHRLLVIPSTNFTKTVQSKLYANPAYWSTKTENELHGIYTLHSGEQNVAISIDNEDGTGVGNALVNLVPPAGIHIDGPRPIGQQGRLMGVTLTTTSADLELNSLMIQERVETLNI